MKKRILSILLAVAMLASVLVVSVSATDAYNAVATVQNKQGSGIEVVVTADTGAGDYNVYFVDPAGQEVQDEGITTYDAFYAKWANAKAENNFTSALGDSVVKTVVVALANDPTATGKDTGKSDVTGLTAGKKYWYVAYANSQTVPPGAEIELDANGRIKEPLSVNTDAITKSDATVGTTFTIDLSGKVSGGSGNYTYEWDTSSAARPAGVELKNGKITGTPEAVTTGAVALKVKVSDNGGANYDANLITVNLTVGKGAATVALAPASGTYTGSAHTPAVTVKLAGTASTSFNTTWNPAGLTDAGTYTGTVALTGDAADNYAITGGNTVTYTINKADPDGEVEFTFDEEKEDLTLADITVDITGVLGVDGNTLPGEFAFLDENGDPIDEADLADYPVTPDTAYDYRFTPTDVTNYNVAENDVTFLGQPQEPDAVHKAYITGRPGNIFAPDDNLPRNEAAIIMARVSEGFDSTKTYNTSFEDISNEWGKNYIAYCQTAGILNGRDADGKVFDPTANITRGEFAKMLASFVGGEQGTADVSSCTFTDVKDNFYGPWIAYLQKTYPDDVVGRGDGKFYPEENIKRSEAVKLVNAILNRGQKDVNADNAALALDVKFSDVTKDKWFFNHVMEAAIEHKENDAPYHK